NHEFVPPSRVRAPSRDGRRGRTFQLGGRHRGTVGHDADWLSPPRAIQCVFGKPSNCRSYMKLRIQGNSLRLRLTQKEVALVRDRGLVESLVEFAPGRSLVYLLEGSPNAET